MYRRVVATLFLLAAVAIWPAQLKAQEDHSSHTAVGWVPREILQRPIELRAGIGKVNDVVTTSSQDAQAFYNQGLAYLHSYIWIEAARSFNQALRQDSKLAMAYLGLSYAYSGLDDQAAAKEMFAKAKSLSSTATEREQQKIEMRGKQLAAMAAPEARESQA